MLALALTISLFAGLIPASAASSSYNFANFSKNELVKLADGVTLSTMLTADSGFISAGQRINLLSVDLSAKNITMEMVFNGNASYTLRNVKAKMNEYDTSMSSKKRPLAGFNADWFNTTNYNMKAETTSQYNIPFGCDVVDGEIFCSQYSGAEWPYGGAIPPYVFGITSDNKPLLGEPKISVSVKNDTQGTSITADGINRAPVQNSIMVYNNRMRGTYAVNSDSYEIEIQVSANKNRFYMNGTGITGKIVKIYPSGTTSRAPLSSSNVIITMRYNESAYQRTDKGISTLKKYHDKLMGFKVGDQISITTSVRDALGVNGVDKNAWKDCKYAAGGNFLILKNGVGVNETALKNDTSYYPTCMIGLDKNGKVLLANVSQDSGKDVQGATVSRRGLRMNEMTKFAKAAGFESCFLFDGGGSATLITATSESNGTLVDRGNYDDSTGIRSVYDSFVVFYDANKKGGTTPAPTAKPTATPTPKVTAKPTAKVTTAPTAKATAQVTGVQTADPKATPAATADNTSALPVISTDTPVDTTLPATTEETVTTAPDETAIASETMNASETAAPTESADETAEADVTAETNVTPEPETTAETKPGKKGCFGVIGGAGIIMVIAAGAAIALRKKED